MAQLNAQKERPMIQGHGRKYWLSGLTAILAITLAAPPETFGACCYFSAKDQDILQPAQKVFITWDPVKKQETFTVQPKFEGNAQDFGMVIPTPTQPKLHAMPRDFFKHLALYSNLKKREFPKSKLLPQYSYLQKAMSAPNSPKADGKAGEGG